MLLFRKSFRTTFKTALHTDKILLNEKNVALGCERDCCHIMIDGDLLSGESTRVDV